jgi:hypothetical protein
VSIIESVAQALAGLKNLSIDECEREFNCKLILDDVNPRQYRGFSTDLNIDFLAVRIGETGGVVVANFKKGVQQVLAEEVEFLGRPEDFDIVSPPIRPVSPPAWSRKWSVAHAVAGAKIWFGFEEIDGRKLLLSASRSFSHTRPAR